MNENHKINYSLKLNQATMKEALKRKIRRTLARHKLRNTQCRYAVLRKFLKTNEALSHSELEKSLQDFDRVTIYRTINTFVEKGLLHKVPDASGGTMKYALCSSKCSPEDHNHEHVHFQCVKCGSTECLDETQLPDVSLPRGYTRADANLLVQGVCPKCNN
jgi:Fur family transcriptional regulator, ferric uptake regulator